MGNNLVQWNYAIKSMDWDELCQMYRAPRCGNKKTPAWLQTTFSNSMLKFFARIDGRPIAAGHAVEDAVDCSFICDIAVEPPYQGQGLGLEVLNRQIEAPKEHQKIILYAVPGIEGFYRKIGFRRLKTAMVIFENPDQVAICGYAE